MKERVQIQRRWKKSHRYLASVAIVLIAGVPAVLAHTGSFSDVPHGAPFHDEINAIRDAGITTGCTSTSYCPNSAVTRGQMAAFMKRGFGFADRESEPGPIPINEADELTVLDLIEVNVPGATNVPGAVQTVKVETKGSISVTTPCECDVVLFLTDLAPNGDVTQLSDGSLYQFNTSSVPSQTMVDSWVFQAPPGINNFLVWAFVTDNSDATLAELSAEVITTISTTFPFGSLEAQPAAQDASGTSHRVPLSDEAMDAAIARFQSKP